MTQDAVTCLTCDAASLTYATGGISDDSHLRDVELLAEVGVHNELLRSSAAGMVAAAPRGRDDQELVAQVREGLQASAAAQRRPDADAVAHLPKCMVP